MSRARASVRVVLVRTHTRVPAQRLVPLSAAYCPHTSFMVPTPAPSTPQSKVLIMNKLSLRPKGTKGTKGTKCRSQHLWQPIMAASMGLRRPVAFWRGSCAERLEPPLCGPMLCCAWIVLLTLWVTRLWLFHGSLELMRPGSFVHVWCRSSNVAPGRVLTTRGGPTVVQN